MNFSKAELELLRDLLERQVEELEESESCGGLDEYWQNDLASGRSSLEKVNIELDLLKAEEK